MNDIRSLTDFQRHTKEHVRRLRRTGRPVVLTINGRAALVVQSADAYARIQAALAQAGIEIDGSEAQAGADPRRGRREGRNVGRP